MATEIRILAYSAVLLVIYVLAAGQAKTAQYGAKWNVGPRDEPIGEPSPVVGRLMRAQANFLETYPVAIVALLGVVIAEKASASTALGGWLWLGSRVVYLPLYAAGVPVIRSVVWSAGMVGLAMVLWPLLVP